MRRSGAARNRVEGAMVASGVVSWTVSNVAEGTVKLTGSAALAHLLIAECLCTRGHAVGQIGYGGWAVKGSNGGQPATARVGKTKVDSCSRDRKVSQVHRSEIG